MLRILMVKKAYPYRDELGALIDRQHMLMMYTLSRALTEEECDEVEKNHVFLHAAFGKQLDPPPPREVLLLPPSGKPSHGP
jgi:hypothetical protein